MFSTPFRRLAIANRGEIANRILDAARVLGIYTVALHSEADRNSLYVKMSNKSVEIGPPRAIESYLNIDRVIEAAVQTKSDALHPGYGFLAENSELARRCEDLGIEFIGPRSDTIRTMASKSSAAKVAQKVSMPILPGYRGSDQDSQKMLEAAKKIGFPVLLKSALGGGGRGMRVVENENDFQEKLLSARSESREAFHDEEILIEKYLPHARHIEVQIIGDKHGNYRHLFDRDCSAQRRHQKIVEEAPAQGIPSDTREQMLDAAVRIAKELEYWGVGTVEYLFDGKQFYFMEMNTRLQVEYTVTGRVMNMDMIGWQIKIAGGQSLEFLNTVTEPVGHSIQARIYAENPAMNFMPSPGNIDFFSYPINQENLSISTDCGTKDVVHEYYDPMIAKVVIYSESRMQAIQNLLEALEEVLVVGVKTNVKFLSNLLQHSEFQKGGIDIHFVESNLNELIFEEDGVPEEIFAIASVFSSQIVDQPEAYNDSTVFSPWAAKNGWRQCSQSEIVKVWEINGESVHVTIHKQKDDLTIECNNRLMACEISQISDSAVSILIDNTLWQTPIVNLDTRIAVFHRCSCYELRYAELFSSENLETKNAGSLVAPLPGRICRIMTSVGSEVCTGECLVVVEAMKMEHQLRSPVNGVVSKLFYKENDQVDEGAICAVVEPFTNEA